MVVLLLLLFSCQIDQRTKGTKEGYTPLVSLALWSKSKDMSTGGTGDL